MSTITGLTITILFVALIFLIMRKIIQYGVWPSLLKNYKTPKQAEELNAQKLNISLCFFDQQESTNMYKFYETENGLLIGLVGFAQKNKDNVLIPWSDLSNCQKSEYICGGKSLDIGVPPITKLHLYSHDFKKIEKYL